MSTITIRSANFEWTDLPGLHDLVVRSWSALGPRSPIHLGDLYWMLRPDRSFEPTRDIRLWKNTDDRVVAAAFFSSWASGEVLAEPGGALTVEGVAWLEASHRASEWAAEHPHFSFETWEDGSELENVVRAQGYLPGPRWGVRLAQAIDSPEASALPPGFRFVPVTADREVLRQRAAVMRSAFTGSSASVETWEGLGRSRGYRADLDVLLVDANGQGASAALCWYDEVNHCGEFEPVGTDPRYHGLGLGKAVMAEGLRRLAALGAERAVVGAEVDNQAAVRLYESAGFSAVGYTRLWRKDF